PPHSITSSLHHLLTTRRSRCPFTLLHNPCSGDPSVRRTLGLCDSSTYWTLCVWVSGWWCVGVAHWSCVVGVCVCVCVCVCLSGWAHTGHVCVCVCVCVCVEVML